MVTLYIDTHYLDIDLVLFSDAHIMAHKQKQNVLNQSEHVVGMIEDLLNENNIRSNEIDEIFVINGPGSFTGIRLGVTVSKTMAYLGNIPIKSFTYLEAMASCLEGKIRNVALCDKNGYYIASFDENMTLIKPYQYVKKSDFVAEEYHVDVKLDYEKMKQYVDKLDPMNPHVVNPFYIKNFEVQNGKRSSN